MCKISLGPMINYESTVLKSFKIFKAGKPFYESKIYIIDTRIYMGLSLGEIDISCNEHFLF